ncbi:hypothetical protein H4582DRAFT_2102257 [Lactarius indigo]|nr:hypothetical protein H4582DRAFT_2102257 [Lactarius indigo]
MTAPQHDIAVHPKTVIPKSPLKGPQLSHVLLTQPSAIHNQQSFDFETMEIFAKAEKKRLGFLNSPDKCQQCCGLTSLRRRVQAYARAQTEPEQSEATTSWRREGRIVRRVSWRLTCVIVHQDRSSTALHGCIRFMPIVRRDSPCYTSLSSSVRLIGFGIAHIYSHSRHYTLLLRGTTSSDNLDTPSLPSPIQVLDDVPSTGPQASLNSSVTGSDCASSPESPSPMLASASHGPSRPRLSSVPDPDAVAGQSEGFIAERNDALDPPSAIRGNIMAASVLPPSNGQYDIV